MIERRADQVQPESAGLDQALAVIKGARGELEARRFAEFINGAQGRSTMRKYGFILSGEAMPD